MSKMTSTERETYLAELHVGVIAVERPDRAPLSVPIWYAYEPGGELLVSSLAGSLKARLITAAGRFSITAQDETYPYRYVTAEGSVTSIETADDASMRAIAIRYLGEEGGNAFSESFARDHPDAESLLFRMRPERWLSVDYSKES
jgi:PPOX class probable F420-dependent enzyme